MTQRPFTLKAFTVGCLMCFLLAIGGPYVTNISKGSYMMIDFTTGGAVFLFTVICLLLNPWLRFLERWRFAGLITSGALIVLLSVSTLLLYHATALDTIEKQTEIKWLVAFTFILGVWYACFLSAIIDGLVEESGLGLKLTVSALLIVLSCGVYMGGRYLLGLLGDQLEFRPLENAYRTGFWIMWLLTVIAGGVYYFAVSVSNPGEQLRLSLSRVELIVVYIMMLIACAIPTMGLSQQLLPILPSPIYYATDENRWVELIHPYLPSWILPTDLKALKYFYEGAPPDYKVPWHQWASPLAYWSIFVTALYFVMISMMVVLRKQWVERERLIYPLVRLPIDMVERSEEGLVAPFFKNRLTWVGFAIPFILGTSAALHNYFPSFPNMMSFTVQYVRRFPFPNQHTIFRLSWPVLGFTYLVNLDISLSLWLFNILLNLQAGLTEYIGLNNPEDIGIYGIGRYPDLAHQGMGAIVVMVIAGLWVARGHLKNIFKKAIYDDESVDDSEEMMSYRTALFGTIAGLFVMGIWLKVAGLPALPTVLFTFGAFVLFVGLTRIVVEGVGEGVASTISSSFVVSKLGVKSIGPAGLVALAFTYIWAGDLRTFVMASTANGLKLTEGFKTRMRPLFWYAWSAIIITCLASSVYLLKISYQYGGVNNNAWFFGGGARAPFKYIAPKITSYHKVVEIENSSKLGKEPTKEEEELLRFAGPNIRGWIFSGVGALAMFILITLRHTFIWWPLHPLGFPFAPVWLMNQIWFSIFLGWLIKLFVLKYGGSRLFTKLRPAFLGLIMGTFGYAGFWNVIDFFTGKIRNGIFWI